MNTPDILHCITVYGKPDELILTVGGEVPYRLWLESEMQRICRRTSFPLGIHTNEATGEIALVHYRVKRG